MLTAVAIAGSGIIATGVQAAATSPAITTVYYSTAKGWSNYYLHYKVGTGSWTTAPGQQMSAACDGWVSTSVAASAETVTAAFNNGSGTWDNNSNKDYTFSGDVAAISAGTITTTNPCGRTTKVYYSTSNGWSAYNLHYRIGSGAWTSAPGVAMAAACTGWVVKEVTTNGLGITAAFNNGSGTWDNNSNRDYALTGDVAAVKAGAISSTDPCPVVATPTVSGSATVSPSPSVTVVSPTATQSASVTATQSPSASVSVSAGGSLMPVVPAGSVRVYYYRNSAWGSTYLHHKAGSAAWTAAPGVVMSAACAGWYYRDVATDNGSVEVVFNNGSGTWDNNNNANYKITSGNVVTVSANRVTSSVDVCEGKVIDGAGPSATVSASVSATVSASVSATVSASVSPTATTSVSVTPSVSVVPGTWQAGDDILGGSVAGLVKNSMIGTDPREDAIYFIMTARFYDGVPSNNVGGSANVSSGNAANNDPMFRGDFQGVIDKLDYIKGLGFGAIWITPVVTNRSDYDFHGYHGWDFMRVDPRLETPGASYADLIAAAHKKGLKIYQDVVFNHSSRWGEKNLYSTTVFGTQDSEWAWYYDSKVTGPNGEKKVYNPAKPDADGSTYNGDLWSTTKPADSNCPNWGVFSGYGGGRKNYNCQWPNPEKQMFPAQYFHQCWIKNWEDKTAQDCWIHEDLADFNTESKVVQDYLLDVYKKYMDMGVDGFRIDTAVHISRVTWNRRFLPELQAHAQKLYGDKGQNFYIFGEVAQFVHDLWNRGLVNHSAPFYTWKERRTYSDDDAVAAQEGYTYEENTMTNANQPTSTNAKLNGNAYHAPDHSKASGMNIIDMRMHMNFDNAGAAFGASQDSDTYTNDATYNVVYVDSHDYGPSKSSTRFSGGTAAWAENMSLMWTYRGIPTLYYGSEIEFQAGVKIDCGPTCPLATTGRAYYGDKLTGTITASDYGVATATGNAATTMSQPLVKHLQTLNRIRRAVPALQKGQYSTEGVSGAMGFKRRYTDSTTDSFVLVAISGTARFSGIPNGTYVDAVTGASMTVSNGSATVAAIGQGNMRAYVLNTALTKAPGKVGNGSPYLN